MNTENDPANTSGGVSRRRFLAGISASVAGTGIAGYALGARSAARPVVVEYSEPEAAPVGAAQVPFAGAHQAGIMTPAQAHLNLVGFQLRAGSDRAAVRRLMRLWTQDASRLCAGRPPLGDLEEEMVVNPASLTITCGFGPRFFDVIDRVSQRPEWLQPLPAFSKDALDERWGQTDIVLQLCCDDPITLSHATRHMIRAGVDYAVVAWMQQGFLSAGGVLPPGHTPRNLFGQKDGTVNPRSEADFEETVWIDEGPEWLRGGSALVVRRIAMDLDEWERLDRGSREVAIGRTLDTGAPLSGGYEFDSPNFQATDEYGLPKIDPASHVARSTNPVDQPHQKLLRRAYNYDVPPAPGSTALSDAGLVFICYQQDPLQQFLPIQQRLDEKDRLNQWIVHIGSAVYACPPGVSVHEGRGDADAGASISASSPDAFWGARLLAD